MKSQLELKADRTYQSLRAIRIILQTAEWHILISAVSLTLKVEKQIVLGLIKGDEWNTSQKEKRNCAEGDSKLKSLEISIVKKPKRSDWEIVYKSKNT